MPNAIRHCPSHLAVLKQKYGNSNGWNFKNKIVATLTSKYTGKKTLSPGDIFRELDQTTMFLFKERLKKKNIYRFPICGAVICEFMFETAFFLSRKKVLVPCALRSHSHLSNIRMLNAIYRIFSSSCWEWSSGVLALVSFLLIKCKWSVELFRNR